jgi:fructokinase
MPGDAPSEGSVLVVGEALVDVVVRPGLPDDERPGGSPANVAVALARLGRPTTLATRLGTDAHGALVARHLAESGVALTDGSTTGDVRTSVARAVVDSAGQATYTFDLAWDPDLSSAPPAGLVHTGSVAATLEPGGSAVVGLLRERRPVATITYDLNVRPPLMSSPEAVRPRIEEIAGLSDLVKASDEDLEWLYPGVACAPAARALLERGPAAVVVTRGAAGALVLSRGGEVEVPAVPVTVVDTIGAGDTFAAGLVHALGVRGLYGDRVALHALPVREWRQAAHFAARLAASTASRRGADPPYLAEARGWPT